MATHAVVYICKQVISPSIDAILVNASMFVPRRNQDQLVFLDNVRCSGTESSLLECSRSIVGNYMCSLPRVDIGVSCAVPPGECPGLSPALSTFQLSLPPSVQIESVWKVMSC